MAKRSVKKADEGRKLAIDAARMADDNNCQNVVVLDLRGVSPVTDYFVIATGTSDRQIGSVADDIIEYGKSIGQPAYKVAGMEHGDWVVLDFVDVVVHIFDEDHRKYYDLELIWGEVPHIRWKRPAKRKTAKTE